MDLMRKIFYIAITAMCICACDDTTDELGTTLTNDVDRYEILLDTFDIQTRSIIADSILSMSTYSYLGHIKDPETNSYVTSHYMSQFAVLETLDEDDEGIFPPVDSILSLDENGDVHADSCLLHIYFYSSVGDSLNPMHLSIYEMGQPVEEGVTYYTTFDPEEAGMLREDENAIRKSKVYTTLDLNLSDSLRGTIVDKTNMEVVTVSLNDPYIDVNGDEYDNFGTFLMKKFYENADYFKNSYNFIHKLFPGFYVKCTDGLGVMSEVYLTEIAVYYRYLNDSTYDGSLLLSGTEEVLQTTRIIYDKSTIEELAEDSTCTYLKTPAGIFTEVTLPIMEIKDGYENDTISSAKIVFNRINDTDSEYAFGEPTQIIMLPKDSLYSFFENKDLPDYVFSYVGTYSSTYNTYTFNNISSLVNAMYDARMIDGETSEDWNKVVLVPVSITYNSSSSTSSVTSVMHEMQLKSTRLVGGYQNARTPLKISVIYNRFIKDE